MEEALLFTNVMRALSNTQRLSILVILRKKILTVSEIQSALALPEPAISKHLRILKNAKLVYSYKCGLKKFHYVADGDYVPKDFLNYLKKLKEDGFFDIQRNMSYFKIFLSGEEYIPPEVLSLLKFFDNFKPNDSFERDLWIRHFFDQNEDRIYSSSLLVQLRPYFDF